MLHRHLQGLLQSAPSNTPCHQPQQGPNQLVVLVRARQEGQFCRAWPGPCWSGWFRWGIRHICCAHNTGKSCFYIHTLVAVSLCWYWCMQLDRPRSGKIQRKVHHCSLHVRVARFHADYMHSCLNRSIICCCSNHFPACIKGTVAQVKANLLANTTSKKISCMAHTLSLETKTCYRCHPDISRVPNTLFYNGHLLDGCTAGQRPALAPGLAAVCFLETQGYQQYAKGSSSASNRAEAQAVVQVRRHLHTFLLSHN